MVVRRRGGASAVTPALAALATLVLASVAATTTACSGIVDPSKNQIQQISGTIPVQSSSTNPFSTGRTGEFSVKVTSLTPNTGAFFGVILAQGPSDGTCSGNLPIFQQNSFATVNTIALSGPIYPGNYCVYVYDIGSFTVPETYTGQISFP
jgi:hypothetical protein